MLTYGEQPGMKRSELSRKLFYGRTGLTPPQPPASLSLPPALPGAVP